jgi:hypothetical protein
MRRQEAERKVEILLRYSMMYTQIKTTSIRRRMHAIAVPPMPPPDRELLE